MIDSFLHLIKVQIGRVQMIYLVLGIVVFFGHHSIRMFTPHDQKLKITKRDMTFKSLVSLLGLSLIIWGYAQARLEPIVIYNPPVWMKHITMSVMLLAFIAMMIFVIRAGKLKSRLKYPLLIAIKFWALSHLLVNGDLASLILFGSFLSWAVINRIAVKKRGDQGSTEVGPITNDSIAIVCAILLYALFVWKLHFWLIGLPIL
jgi:uncharacterized membrane protein